MRDDGKLGRLVGDLKPRQTLIAEITFADRTVKKVPLLSRIDTLDELDYFKNGGILHFDGSKWTSESADTGLELRAVANDGTGTVRVFSDGTAILRRVSP